VGRDDEARIDAAIAYGEGRAGMVVRRDLHGDDDVLGGSGDGQNALDEVALVPQRGVRIDAVTHRQGDLRRLPGGQDAHDPHPAIMTCPPAFTKSRHVVRGT